MRNRANAKAARHYSHIHLPKMRDAKDWLRKPLAREIETNAALIVVCSSLIGWTLFSLMNAIQSGHVSF